MTAHECAVIGNLLLHPNKLVEDHIAVPVDDGYAGEGRAVSTGAASHHLAVDGNTSRLFLLGNGFHLDHDLSRRLCQLGLVVVAAIVVVLGSRRFATVVGTAIALLNFPARAELFMLCDTSPGRSCAA